MKGSLKELALAFFVAFVFSVGNAVAQGSSEAYNFYFLPPSHPESEWIGGSPRLVYNDNGVVKSITLDTDEGRCGWYRTTFSNSASIPRIALIWLSSMGDDQIGLFGLDEDPIDWVDGMPTPFNLLEQFGNAPGDLFFVPARGVSGWYKTYPNIEGVCSSVIVKNDLSVLDIDQVSINGAQVCIESSSSGDTGSGKCGSEMGDILNYYLLNRRGDRLELSIGNENCKMIEGNLVCYGGITLTSWPMVNRIQVKPASVYGLTGTQRIYVRVKDSELSNFPNANPVFITSFATSFTAVEELFCKKNDWCEKISGDLTQEICLTENAQIVSTCGSTPIRLPQISSANSVFTVQNTVILQAQNSGRLDIYNLNGKLAKTLNFTNGTHSVSLSHLPKGMYIIKVSFDGGVGLSYPIILRTMVM
ncbi:MAG: T9SS type A sorting domain-containing protein [Candidatus Fibromonas sp.]|jgi:hypothetical protein|nr:T9SS type A sorting domain-containing protein [Candidatus Fibromonas sp.]